jgi:hypothetical protein
MMSVLPQFVSPSPAPWTRQMLALTGTSFIGLGVVTLPDRSLLSHAAR